MPILSDEATVSHRLQLSKLALIRCCSCFFATIFGTIAITVSFRLVAQVHGGTPAYWSTFAILLVVWLASLINMYRLAIGELRAAARRGSMRACAIGVKATADRAACLPRR